MKSRVALRLGMMASRKKPSASSTQGTKNAQPECCELAGLVDVAAVRTRLGFTQARFAARSGLSVAALRHCEGRDRGPQGAARVLLNLIDGDPQEARRALS